MRIRFKIGDPAWYVSNESIIVGSTVDFIAVDPNYDGVYCSVLVTTAIDAIPKRTMVSQNELFKTYRLAKRSLQGG